LYLPLLGILLVLPQTKLLPSGGDGKRLVTIWAGVCVVFAGLNYNHQQYFNDPVAFWSQAVETSPNSAYANMMLAARLDKSEVQRSEAMFRKAYQLNPKEKYLNFYMAEALQRKDSVLASEPYLLAEKQISDYVKCDFYMARVQMEKGNRDGAIASLERYLSRDRFDAPAHNNLLLMLLDAGQTEKARAHITEMRQNGMSVHPAIAARAAMQ
jgi:tetratricopeptide (TPR) repeat protein